MTYSKFVKIKIKDLAGVSEKTESSISKPATFLYAEKENKDKNTKYTKPNLKYIFSNICTSLQSKESVEVKLVIQVGVNCSKFDCSTINWSTLLAGNQISQLLESSKSWLNWIRADDKNIVNCLNPVLNCCQPFFLINYFTETA